MNIAVNTKNFSKKNNSNNYIEEVLIAFVQQNSRHQFIFLTDSILPEAKNILSANSKTSKNALSSRLWNSITLPGLLKKHKADCLINTQLIAPINTKVPLLQIIDTVSDISISKKNALSILHLSKKIITTSNSLKKKITDQYKIAEEKIAVLYTTPKEIFIPIDWHSKQPILKKYSAEKEYFLFSDENYDETTLIELLKAFSIFKKWQKSNLQLIIAIKDQPLPESFLKSLKSYKYRDEVIILDCDEILLATIIACAYCFIYLNKNDMYLPLLQAFQCNVPAITINTELMQEICANASLYCIAGDFNDLSKNMILVYKDETLRNELIKNGAALIKKADRSKTLAVLSTSIEETLQA